MENEAACLTRSRLPLPRSFGATQRFARRFDESLLVELDVVPVAAAAASARRAGQYYDACEQNPFAEGCTDGG